MRTWRAYPQQLGNSLSTYFPRSYEAIIPQAQAKGWQVDDPSRYCPRCGQSTGPGGYTADGCSACYQSHQPWDAVVRLSAYQPPMTDWIHALKFDHDWSWATWLGRQLGNQMATHSAGLPNAVCPVPMHWLRRAARGYNQSDLLADATGLPVLHLLKRGRYTHPQTSTSVTQRIQNVKDSFMMRKAHLHLGGWCIWLIDDVKTSGATLGQCARLLRHAGASRVHVAVVAVADQA